MREILIDLPGAGDWIMDRVGDRFNPATDHSFSTHLIDLTTGSNRILGGFVTCEYLGNSMRVHMAADDPRWFSRELAWLVCDYAFNQCGCGKLVIGVRSDNLRVLDMCRRGGWRVETTIADLYEPGVGMTVLAMSVSSCPWLNYQPKHFRSTVAII
jgi:hypothetical protein